MASEPGCGHCDGTGCIPVAGDGRRLVECPTCHGTRGIQPGEIDEDYTIEVSKPGLFYRIEITQGLLVSQPHHTAITFAGARRKGERIVRRYRRRDGRAEVLERWVAGSGPA